MQCESRTVRTVTTKYRDSEGNVKSKRRAELSGKSVLYEGEYSETDSEAELDTYLNNNNNNKNNNSTNQSNNKPKREPKFKRPQDDNVPTSTTSSTPKTSNTSNSLNAGSNSLKTVEIGHTANIRIGNHVPFTNDPNMIRRQKLLEIPEVELKAVKATEFNELIDENCCDDEAKMQAKINDHLSIKLKNSAFFGGSDQTHSQKATNGGSSAKMYNDLISDETKSDEKCDVKVIDSTDEKTGIAIRTSIENKMKSNENVKVCKADNVVDVQETDDAVVKKITTKTRTTKSVVKTTTTTTTKKGILL